nr:MAG TPA: hypothetical protein [Caudoviricetes sp.]
MTAHDTFCNGRDLYTTDFASVHLKFILTKTSFYKVSGIFQSTTFSILNIYLYLYLLSFCD